MSNKVLESLLKEASTYPVHVQDMLVRAFEAGKAEQSPGADIEPGLHELKIMPEYFEAVRKGEKTFEIRHNDRNYQVDDTLVLREFDPLTGYTDRFVIKKVSYITGYAQKENYVVMAIV